MTIEERVQHAISGLRLKTDELGRPPSHDEVEALLFKAVDEATADTAKLVLQQAESSISEMQDREDHLIGILQEIVNCFGDVPQTCIAEAKAVLAEREIEDTQP